MNSISKSEIKALMVEKSGQAGVFAKNAGKVIDYFDKSNSSSGNYVVKFTDQSFAFFWRKNELNAFLESYEVAND